MHECFARYRVGVRERSIPRDVLEKAAKEFDKINTTILQLTARNFVFRLHSHTAKVRDCLGMLRTLEQHIDVCGLLTHESKSVHKELRSWRDQMKILSAAVRKTPESQNDSRISSVLERMDATLSDDGEGTDQVEDAYVFTNQARDLFYALLDSGIAHEKKSELSEMARNVWEEWQVNPNDIKFARNHGGDRELIGRGEAGDVSLAHMRIRDENDNIIDNEHVEVAVKQCIIHHSKVEEHFPPFMREVFLQKHAQHPCIVRTFGGYWPGSEKFAGKKALESWIVMERMTDDLNDVLHMNLLTSIEEKRRVLADIAEGIQLLHSRGIVHRDIKPENVMMNVVDGQIIGRAKLCDFGISRKAEKAGFLKDSIPGFPAGTFIYMGPEAFHHLSEVANTRNRDIWSFGVLLCVVLDPNFIKNLYLNWEETRFTECERLPKLVAQAARNSLCGGGLGDLAVSCLSLNPKLRPKIGDICEILGNEPMEI